MTTHNSEFEYDTKAFVLQLADAFNGMASQDELAELNAILVRSADAREVAINFFKDESLLHEELHGCAVKSSFHSDLAIPLYELARTSGTVSESPSESSPASADNSPRSKRLRNRLRFTSFSALAAAIAIAFGVVQSSRDELPEKSLSEIRVVNCSTSVLTDEGRELAPGASVHSGDTLVIEEGIAELSFQSGVRLFLKGPASLQVVSPMQTLLTRGVVTASVEESAHGFRVDTPTSLVTDLGTEFGVSVADGGDTDIVVFTGEVALRRQDHPDLANQQDRTHFERGRFILEGEGLRVREHGTLERLVSINSSDYPRTFCVPAEDASPPPIISSVTDNLSTSDTIKCYQIIHNGFDEDVQAFVDRRYQWNGINAEHGLPQMLRQADYIMPFCDDKFNDHIEIKVDLAQPARVFVLIDNRLTIPTWLKEEFEDSGYDVAVDEDAHTGRRKWQELGQGPGGSLEKTCSVWFKDVPSPETVTFGAVEPPANWSLMYGIAAVPLAIAKSIPMEPISNHTPNIGSGLIREEFLPEALATTNLESNRFYSRLSIKSSADDAAAYSRGMRFLPETLGGKLLPYRHVRLVDGAMPAMNEGLTARHNRQFARCAWYNGQARFSLDLKRSVNIESINCFSRHDGVRSWQYFTVWGSNAKNKPNVDFDRPDQAKGWDYIGLVDSRDQSFGGIHASSLRAADGPIGSYRHLLWICERVRYSTCFTEIDVHEVE